MLSSDALPQSENTHEFLSTQSLIYHQPRVNVCVCARVCVCVSVCIP